MMGGKPKGSPLSCSARKPPMLSASNSPFQRSRSRVMYESDALLLSLSSDKKKASSPMGEDSKEGVVWARPIRVSEIPSAEEEDATSPFTRSRSRVCFQSDEEQPFRRSSPSHKSQDSGFSDSGESGGGSFSSRGNSSYSTGDEGFDRSGLVSTTLPDDEEVGTIAETKLKPTSASAECLDSGPVMPNLNTKLSASYGNGLSVAGQAPDVRKFRQLVKPLSALPPPPLRMRHSTSSSDSECEMEVKSINGGRGGGGMVASRRNSDSHLGAQYHSTEHSRSSTFPRSSSGGSIGGDGSMAAALPSIKHHVPPTPGGYPRDSLLRQHLKENVRRSQSTSVNSVLCWLQDIRTLTENECTNMLQSKAIAKNIADLIALATKNTKDTITAIETRSNIISVEFSKLFRKLEKGRMKHLRSGCLRVSSHIRSLVHDYNATAATDSNAPSSVNLQKLQDSVLNHSSNLLRLSQRADKTSDVSQLKEALSSSLTSLSQGFWDMIDTMLLQEIKMIIDSIEEPYNAYCLKTSILNLTTLGLDGEAMCSLIAKVGGVRSLLGVCVEPKYKFACALALRAVATVCCGIEGIRELEKVRGVECISEILCDPQSKERVKSEAAGVIAQITSPWIDNNHRIQGLAENMADLITALTDLAGSTRSPEVFLLSTAALANITFLHSQACDHLLKAKTASVIIKASREKGFAESVFTKDQVATILANLAAVVDCRPDVVEPGGVVLLLCFLQVRPSSIHGPAELAACERVQQKSAIALSRLCTNPQVAQQVVDLQGVQRLVRLCKDAKERNQSDAVLVACLAALRKIATACGMEEFRQLNATELVEPRLLDSFLIYSSRQESYV